MYEELIKALRDEAEYADLVAYMHGIKSISHGDATAEVAGNWAQLFHKAADAIEELLKAAKAMHTWIFLNTGDEQAAYDECGLTDEMNAMLGYGGQFAVELPKEET